VSDRHRENLKEMRRFLDWRLFLSLATAGWSGHGQHMERTVELAGLLKSELSGDGRSIVNDSPLAVLCFTPAEESGEVKSIVNRVLATGRAWIAATAFERHSVIRACITHGETAREDVFALVGVLGPWAGAWKAAYALGAIR
jgi:hypothetical protein